MRGFQNSCWCLDESTGELIAVSVWETREQAEFSRASANPSDGPNLLEDAGLRLDSPEIFEIVAQIP
jgi:hypothetical protein